jgi:NADH:ubiquinone oxidoreductase subunit C
MSTLPQGIESRLAAAAPAGIAFRQTANAKKVVTAWCVLASKDEIFAAASLLRDEGARLSTITVLQPKAVEAPAATEGEPAPAAPTFAGGAAMDGKSYEINYHFDLDGATLTLTAHVPAGGEIDSLTPLYRAADWPEREAMEIYALVVRNHPNPTRLFLDPAIDGAVLERLIPYSTLVNSAASKGLWEKIMAQTGPKS